mgnify:CR=1 FL=1
MSEVAANIEHLWEAVLLVPLFLAGFFFVPLFQLFRINRQLERIAVALENKRP